MKENRDFINKADELEYYKSKYKCFFQELSECHLRIKSLEDSNYQLKEKVANFKKNSPNNISKKIISNNFLTPDEFKKLWEFIIKTDFLDTFDFCINEYILIANLCQDIMLLVYEECKNTIEKKFAEVLTCLNLEKIDKNKRKEIFNCFLPFFRENFSKIFIFSKNFMQIIISKLLIIVTEYNYLEDIINNKEINYNIISDKINQNIFESLIKNFFNICIYMLLHDPSLTFNLTKYKQRKLEYFFYNKNDFINVDGFVNEQDKNTSCIILVPPPLIKNKYIFNGIKPPVYIISNPNEIIISECKKNAKISRNNKDVILLENNNIKTSKIKAITLNNINNNILKKKIKTPIKSISFKDMKTLFSFCKNCSSSSKRYQINNSSFINKRTQNEKSNSNENRYRIINSNFKNAKKYLKKNLTSIKDYNKVPESAERKHFNNIICKNIPKIYKISENTNYEISEKQGISYISQNFINNLNKCPNFINTSSGHSTAINNSISNSNYYEKKIINIKCDSNINTNNTTNTMKNSTKKKNKKFFSFIEKFNEEKNSNNICKIKKLLTPSNHKLKNLKSKVPKYLMDINKNIKYIQTPNHISINKMFNKYSRNKFNTKTPNKKTQNYITKTKNLPSKRNTKNNSKTNNNSNYKLKKNMKKENKSDITDKISNNVLNAKKRIKVNNILVNINMKNIYSNNKIQNNIKELIPNGNKNIIVNCKKINNIANKSLSLTYRQSNEKKTNSESIKKKIVNKSSSSSTKNKLSPVHSKSNIEKKSISKINTVLNKKTNKINYYRYNNNALKTDSINKETSTNLKLFNSFYNKKKINNVTTINKFKNQKYNIKINSSVFNSGESRNNFYNYEKSKSNKNFVSKDKSNKAIINIGSFCFSSCSKTAYHDSCFRTQENYDVNPLFMKKIKKVSEEKNKKYKTEGNQNIENRNHVKKNANLNFMLFNGIILKNKQI